MPVWIGITPYHGGGVPAERVKLILFLVRNLRWRLYDGFRDDRNLHDWCIGP